MSHALALGPLIVGFDGTWLDEATAERLCHPAVGGVILFSRNFEQPEQIASLTRSLHELRTPRLLVTVDQEGGRVQRFRTGLTRLPPLAVLGRWYASHPDRACDLAYRHGRVMAAELLELGVDLSWAPVLDLDRGSSVIGDRAMSADPEAVKQLASWYLAGMRDAGMAACAKHFPGHGSVEADSHHEVVVDARSRPELDADLAPFRELAGQVAAVMMAHVCYPAIDKGPAGFSRVWIGEVLRDQLGFAGLVVSDDLDMVGAEPAGDLAQRLDRAFDAGCDVALVCKPESAERVLTMDRDWPLPPQAAMQSLYGRPMARLDEQLLVPEFRAWRDSLNALMKDE
jgi:beta-N-acetylhexosaminidase